MNLGGGATYNGLDLFIKLIAGDNPQLQQQWQALAYQTRSLHGFMDPGSIMQKTWFTDQTPFGVYQHHLQGAQSAHILSAMDYQRTQFSNSFYRGMAAQATTFQDWQMMDPANNRTRAEYNAYLQKKANDYQNSPFWKGFYRLTDPEGMQEAIRNGGNMYSNLTRGALFGRGFSSYYNADAFISELYANNEYDKTGKLTKAGGALGGGFDKTRFGGYNYAAVTGVASYLSKFQEDKMNGLGGNQSALDAAVQKFTKRIEDITQAMSPLKDLFGNDIKASMQMVESLTGQSVKNLSKSQIASAAENYVNLIATGRVNPAQLAALSPIVSSQMTSLGLGEFRINNMSQATAGAVATVVGANPYLGIGISNNTWKTYSGNLVTRAASGSFNENYARAYAAWKASNPTGTPEDFTKAYDAAVASGAAPVQALAKVAGVSSMAELSGMQNTQAYQEMTRTTYGTSRSIDGSLRTSRNRAARGIMDTKFGSAFLKDHAALGTRAGRSAAFNAIDKMLLSGDGDAIFKDVASIQDYLNENKGIYSGKAEDLFAVYNELQGRKNGREYIMKTQAAGVLKKTERETQEIARQRAYAGNASSLLGTTGEMFDDVRKLMSQGVSLSDALSRAGSTQTKIKALGAGNSLSKDLATTSKALDRMFTDNDEKMKASEFVMGIMSNANASDSDRRFLGMLLNGNKGITADAVKVYSNLNPKYRERYLKDMKKYSGSDYAQINSDMQVEDLNEYMKDSAYSKRFGTVVNKLSNFKTVSERSKYLSGIGLIQDVDGANEAQLNEAYKQLKANGLADRADWDRLSEGEKRDVINGVKGEFYNHSGTGVDQLTDISTQIRNLVGGILKFLEAPTEANPASGGGGGGGKPEPGNGGN